MSNSVLQPWVEKIPWKQQSILFSSLRGPDQDYLKAIKLVSRWMRAVSQQNADPSKPYMAVTALPEPSELDKELEHCTVHFVHHFADGLAVIAYHHPDEPVARYAAELHYHIAEELFHFTPEPRGMFLLRHRDKKDGVDVHADKWTMMSQAARDWFIDAVMHRFESPEAKRPEDVMALLHTLWGNAREGVYDKATWMKFHVAIGVLRAKEHMIKRDADCMWRQTEGGGLEVLPLKDQPPKTI